MEKYMLSIIEDCQQTVSRHKKMDQIQKRKYNASYLHFVLDILKEIGYIVICIIYNYKDH
jgi:hypothetical protein